MRALIIVKHRQSAAFAHTVDVSVDEATVAMTVRELEARYPSERYVIDTSQVELARASVAMARLWKGAETPSASV